MFSGANCAPRENSKKGQHEDDSGALPGGT
jgi:hypothetical protein